MSFKVHTDENRIFSSAFGIQGEHLLKADGTTEDPTCTLREAFQSKHGSYADLSTAKIIDIIKANGLDNAPTNSLFSIASRILKESIERKNGDVSHQTSLLLRNILRMIELRMSVQAEKVRNQSRIYKSRDEKLHSRVKALETLAKGTHVENELAMKNLDQVKVEKAKVEEKINHEECNLRIMKKNKDDADVQISTLKHELELNKKTYEQHCRKLEAKANETRFDYENKLKVLELQLENSRKRVLELEEFSETEFRRWKKKENLYEQFIDFQSGALQDLKLASKLMKTEVLKTTRGYFDKLNYLGVKLKGFADAAQNYHMVLAENRRLYNEVQDLKGNIRVYCRIRPFLQGQSEKHTTIEYMGENGELVVSNPLKQGKDNHKLFKLNKVFGQAATQEEVFLDTRPLIRSILDGYNVCIFAYGQTGSGKTYTMSGPSVTSEENWGVNYRALNDLFRIAESRNSMTTYEVAVQMVEIYNEQVRDLLSTGGSQKKLGILSTTQPNGLAVPDASMHIVKSTKDVLELISLGMSNRAVGATALNERSSRSHSIVTVHVRGIELETDAIFRGNLHLVDLAGSERVDRSEVTGERLREAQHINKSLSALGDVIFALAQKISHVPYRNSKLTQVLQSSLGGQAKTLMFVQLNPDVDSYSETISTLKFAERVSGIELGAAKTNKEGREVRELMERIASLKDTITKKDEEITRLLSVKPNVNREKRLTRSLRYSSASPRRHSTPQPNRSISVSKLSALTDRVALDGDYSSGSSEKNSEGSLQSDESRKKKDLDLPLPPKPDVAMNLIDDVELLGLGDADTDERLSDISDFGLSMGADTDDSLSSVVEYTLFPESTKSTEKRKSPEKEVVTSKLPKLSQKPPLEPKSPRLTRSTAYRVSTGGIRRSILGSSNLSKPSKRWQ